MTPTENFRAFFKQENPVSLFKNALRRENEHLKQHFKPQTNVLDLLIRRSRLIDLILSACWQSFLGSSARFHSLIATGGYGRNELFPHSDVDILILLGQQETPELKQSLSEFSMFLWDIGLKPGQSVRNAEECISQASEDQTIITSLMEMRLIDGNHDLFFKLKTALSREKIWSSEQFFRAKMDEQRERYSKYHDTAYNLEPNIKEGPGGLRDLQIIGWVFKRHYDSQTLRELVKYDFIPINEYEQLIKARDILWRLRYALHLLTDRCEDRLLFDHQRELAVQFGYVDKKKNMPDVEKFMQFFFRTVVQIEQLNEILLQLFSERFVSSNRPPNTTILNDDFSSINGYLEARHDKVFEDNPLNLLDMFLLQQKMPSLKGVRATTIRMVRKSLHLIDEDFRHNKKANAIFIDIMRQPRGITHQLRRMNRYGILSAYLPCFAHITLRMQYDLFHVYTVDEHSLFVVRNLRRFALNKHHDELPFCNNIFLLIPNPYLLYLAGLFHDIGKGLGGDHSVLGEEIARQFCEQHSLSGKNTKLIIWLVRHHLLMSTTAQRKDISDPDVIHDFALRVGSIKYLNYLYLLTVADIRATNPTLWNSWKDSLLKELYIAAHNALHRGLDNPVARSERLQENKKEAEELLLKLGISHASIVRSWKHLNDDYFLRHNPDEIAWHTIAIASCHRRDLPLVLLRPQTQRGSVEIFIYTENRDMLFSICTATLDQLGLSILDARILTTDDQYVLNSFQILEQSGRAIDDLSRETQICSTLRRNLIKKDITSHSNINKQSRQARHFPIKTQVNFLEDPAGLHTIMELIATDRAGLLSLVGITFRKLGIQLHDARITTIGSRVEDMFNISDQKGRPITDTLLLNELSHLLIDQLDNY